MYYGSKPMITLEHLAGSWHLNALENGEERLHHHGFEDRREAVRLAWKVRAALAEGGRLDPEHWTPRTTWLGSNRSHGRLLIFEPTRSPRAAVA